MIPNKRKVHCRPGLIERLELTCKRQKEFIETQLDCLKTSNLRDASHRLRELVYQHKKYRSQCLQSDKKIHDFFQLMQRMNLLLERLEHRVKQKKNEFDSLNRTVQYEKERGNFLLKQYLETARIKDQYKHDISTLSEKVTSFEHDVSLLHREKDTFRSLYMRKISQLVDVEDTNRTLTQQSHAYTCCICLERPINVVMIPCHHAQFCQPCIQEMFHHSTNDEIPCPVCRTQVLSLIPFHV